MKQSMRLMLRLIEDKVKFKATATATVYSRKGRTLPPMLSRILKKGKDTLCSLRKLVRPDAFCLKILAHIDENFFHSHVNLIDCYIRHGSAKLCVICRCAEGSK